MDVNRETPAGRRLDEDVRAILWTARGTIVPRDYYSQTPPKMPQPVPAWNDTVQWEPLARWMSAKYHEKALSGATVMLLEFPPQQ